MIHQLVKLFQVIYYFKKLIFTSMLGSESSKRRLTEMYLDVLYEKSRLKQVIPVQPKSNILIAKERVNDLYVHLPDRLTLLTDKELYALLSLFKEVSPKNVLEIGCFKGGSSYHFLINSDADTKISSIDRSFQNVPTEIMDTLTSSGRFFPIESNSRKFDPAPFKEHFDFIFIDGSHAYEDVKSDTLMSLELLRVGGMIVWDDYSPGFQGVFRCLNEFKDKGYNLLNIQGTSLVYFYKT